MARELYSERGFNNGRFFMSQVKILLSGFIDNVEKWIHGTPDLNLASQR